MGVSPFTIRKIGPLPIFHVENECAKSLAMGFVRMQEYYEGTSTKFRGKVFSLSAYRRWYEKTHEGWTYADDWGGFNVPAQAVRAVRENFPRHSTYEKQIFGLLDTVDAFREERFYMIGTRPDACDDIRHELCHALYYLNDEYHRIAKDIVESYDTSSLRRRLLKRGYPEEVHTDEIQAYSLTSWHLFAFTRREEIITQELDNELKEALTPFLSNLPPLS